MEHPRIIKAGLLHKAATGKKKTAGMEAGSRFPLHQPFILLNAGNRKNFRVSLQKSGMRTRSDREPFQMLSSMVTEGLVIHVKGIILDANHAFAAMTGSSSPKMLAGKHILDLLPFSYEASSVLPEALLREKAEPWTVTAAYPDGRTLHLRVRSRALSFQNHMASMTLFQDVTPYKRLEDAVESLQKQCSQEQDLAEVGRLAVKVAHDFNNQLTTIIGYTELVLSRISSGDPFHMEMKEILKMGERAAVMTRELLESSRKHTAPQKMVRPIPEGPATILLVEDEASGHRLTRPILKHMGCCFLEADSITEAIRICSEYSRAIHLLLADVALEGMSGIELYDNLREIRTEMKALFMSNGSVDACSLAGKENDIIQKPFNENDLRKHLQKVLGSSLPEQ